MFGDKQGEKNDGLQLVSKVSRITTKSISKTWLHSSTSKCYEPGRYYPRIKKTWLRFQIEFTI